MTTSSLNSGKEIIALVDATRYVPIQEVKVSLNYAVWVNGHITGAATLHGQSPGWQAVSPVIQMREIACLL